MRIINKKEIKESFDSYALQGRSNSIQGKRIKNIQQLDSFLKQEGFGEGEGIEYKHIFEGFSRFCNEIYVNLDTGNIQGVSFPYVVTATVSSNEYKAYFSVQFNRDLKIETDLTDFSYSLLKELNNLYNKIKKFI